MNKLIMCIRISRVEKCNYSTSLVGEEEQLIVDRPAFDREDEGGRERRREIN